MRSRLFSDTSIFALLPYNSKFEEPHIDFRIPEGSLFHFKFYLNIEFLRYLSVLVRLAANTFGGLAVR